MGNLYGKREVHCSDGKDRIGHYTTPHAEDFIGRTIRIKVKGKTVTGFVDYHGKFTPYRFRANGNILPQWPSTDG